MLTLNRIKLLVPCLLSLVALAAFHLKTGLSQERPVTVKLFNGSDLAGFYTWLVDSKYADPRGVFRVTNGMVRISGEGLGYLGTKDSFSNYTLRVQFRWGQTNWGNRVGKARDAGIFMHTIGPDGNSADGGGAFRAGIECNIFQGATGDLLLIRGTDTDGSVIAPKVSVAVAKARDAEGWVFWQRGEFTTNLTLWGRVNWFAKDPVWRDVTDFRGRNDIERLPGEWNTLECVCPGNGITVRLNGTIVNQVTNVYPAHGRILLQCEGSEIFFREIELTGNN